MLKSPFAVWLAPLAFCAGALGPLFAAPEQTTGVSRASAQIEIRADHLDFDEDRNLLFGSGNVFLRRDDQIIRARQVTVNRVTQDVWAEGNVFFERGNDVWTGEKLHYNFLTKRGDFGSFDSFLTPYYITAESSRRVSDDEYIFNNAIITTCEGENPPAYFTARRARLIVNKSLHASHVFMYVGGVPVLYSPFWHQNIGARNFISIVPGYNRRMWAFLLTSFNYRLARRLETTTHVDYRMRRGFGLGQDLLWSQSGNAQGLSTEVYSESEDETDPWTPSRGFSSKEAPEEYDSWYGDFISYYLHDQWPDEGSASLSDINSERYRLRLFHSHSFDERNYMLTQMSYLSDTKFLEQFFRDEFRANPEPDDYLYFMHKGRKYNANLLLKRHLNDFYTSTDRLPELSLNFSRQQIAETPFYYEGDNAAVNLEKRWKSSETNESNYSTFRFDSSHTVYYQRKLFGFLNIIPRAGWRGTYYSKTKQDRLEVSETTETETEVTDGVTNEITTVNSTTNVVVEEMSGKFRSVYELGAEVSLKAFKVWQTYPGTVVRDIRHVFEPYVNYTYRPEPNVLATNLYQFDEIDAVKRENGLKLGLRNKIQTRRDKIYDLLELDVWSTYRLSPEQGENEFSEIEFKAKSKPFDDIEFRLDGKFDQYESEMKEINARTTLTQSAWKLETEYRYRIDDTDPLWCRLSFHPGARWAYRVYGRYEFDAGEFEEYGGYIQRNMDCIAARVGANWSDDDYGVWLQLWFTDFPAIRVDLGM